MIEKFLILLFVVGHDKKVSKNCKMSSVVEL